MVPLEGYGKVIYEKVRYLVSDMYKLYINYIDKYFPNAISIVDAFHVIKMINDKLTH